MVLLMLRIFLFPFIFSCMKLSLKPFIPLLLVVALAGCAGTSATTQGTGDTEPTAAAVSSKRADSATSPDDHHAGETNVAPHDDSVASASADHVDDPNEPAHGHSSSHDDSNEPPHRH